MAKQNTRKHDPSFEDLGELFGGFFAVSSEELATLEATSVDAILSKFNVKNILDCACGTGIPSLGLTKLGYAVFASDISPKMVSIVRAKARRDGTKIVTKIADFRTLASWRNKTFDAVICTGNSLPLLNTRRETFKAIDSMRKHLKPNGIIVLGTHNYSLPRRKNERVKIHRKNIPDRIQFDIREFGKRRVNITYIIIKKEQVTFKTTISEKSYAYISPASVAKILRMRGFKHTRLYDMKGSGRYKGGEWGFTMGVNQ